MFKRKKKKKKSKGIAYRHGAAEQTTDSPTLLFVVATAGPGLVVYLETSPLLMRLIEYERHVFQSSTGDADGSAPLSV